MSDDPDPRSMREISIVSTDEEFSLIEAAAKHEGMSVNDFLVMTAEHRVKADVELRTLVEQRRGDAN